MSHVSDIEENDPLLRRARALDPAVEPPDDLWPGIRKAIQRGSQTEFRHRSAERARWTLPRLAAAAVLLVSISSVLTVWLNGEFRNPVPPRGPGYADQMLEGPYHAMGPQFVRARTDLLVSLEKELDELSPESRKVLAENLLNIDEAIREINTALQDNPDSGLLLHLLLSTYTDQLTLLSRIDGMTRAANEAERERTQL